MPQRIAIQSQPAAAAECTPRGRVSGVTGSFPGHQDIERIAAAAQKQANQRFVIRCALRHQTIRHAQIKQRVEEGRRAYGGTIELPQKTAP